MVKQIQPSQKLRDQIMKNRKDLKEISLNSYITSLRSLYKQMNPDNDLKEQLSTDFLKDKTKILQAIKDKVINTRKNILTAILVALSSESKKDDKLLDGYQIYLKELSAEYGKFLEKQEKTPTQEANWISHQDYIKIINKLLEEIKPLVKKDKLKRSEYVLLQKYVVLSLYEQFSFRNDFAMMKVLSTKEYEDLSDDVRKSNNYLLRDKDKFVIKLNAFKNVSRIGVKSFDVSPKLAKILKIWFIFNRSGFVLTLGNGIQGLTPNGITKLLGSIFKQYAGGKSIGSSLLRHITISNALEGMPSIEEENKKKADIEQKFMHSSKMNELYRKLN
jgi:hypothetical protein